METRINVDRSLEKLSIGKALSHVAFLEQQAMAMGANDFEPSAFLGVKKQLQSGEITPEEAVSRAQGILDSKQGYH